MVIPAVDTIDLPGSHINVGNSILCFLQALITEVEIVFSLELYLLSGQNLKKDLARSALLGRFLLR